MPEREINGFEMHYEDEGSGPVLVFQHAWLSAGMVWGGVVPALRDRYRCITFDGRGAGASERTEEGHNSEQYARDLLALADALGVERFTVVGHSSGGFVRTRSRWRRPNASSGWSSWGRSWTSTTSTRR